MMLPKRGEVLSLHLGWKNEPLILRVNLPLMK